MLTQTIQEGISREPSADVQVLRFKDDGCVCGVKQHLLCAVDITQNTKAERIDLTVETQLGFFIAAVIRVGTGKN